MSSFEGKNMQTQYCISCYRIDLCFHYHKLAIENKKYGYSDRNIAFETEKKVGCKFITVDPDEENFNVF